MILEIEFDDDVKAVAEMLKKFDGEIQIIGAGHGFNVSTELNLAGKSHKLVFKRKENSGLRIFEKPDKIISDTLTLPIAKTMDENERLGRLFNPDIKKDA